MINVREIFDTLPKELQQQIGPQIRGEIKRNNPKGWIIDGILLSLKAHPAGLAVDELLVGIWQRSGGVARRQQVYQALYRLSDAGHVKKPETRLWKITEAGLRELQRMIEAAGHKV